MTDMLIDINKDIHEITRTRKKKNIKTNKAQQSTETCQCQSHTSRTR